VKTLYLNDVNKNYSRVRYFVKSWHLTTISTRWDNSDGKMRCRAWRPGSSYPVTNFLRLAGDLRVYTLLSKDRAVRSCCSLNLVSLSRMFQISRRIAWEEAKVSLQTTRRSYVDVFAFKSTSTPVHTFRHNPNVSWISTRTVFLPRYVTATSVSSRTIDSLQSPKTCFICLTSQRLNYFTWNYERGGGSGEANLFKNFAKSY
jgi:hypothetical protein